VNTQRDTALSTFPTQTRFPLSKSKHRRHTISANELTAKVRDLRELQAFAAELQAEIDTLTDALKEEMTARGVEEMAVDVFKVRWTTVKSCRFDTTAFKREQAGLYAMYSKESTTRRFSVA